MNNKIIVTVLGCGSSGGVPRIDGDWGNCNPDEPKNLRSRCSLLVQKFNDLGDGCRRAHIYLNINGCLNNF